MIEMAWELLLAFVQALPNWLMVAATALSAGATVFVAFRAQKVSEEAAATAQVSEEARLAFEKRAQHEAQEDSFKSSLSKL